MNKNIRTWYVGKQKESNLPFPPSAGLPNGTVLCVYKTSGTHAGAVWGYCLASKGIVNVAGHAVLNCIEGGTEKKITSEVGNTVAVLLNIA